MLSRLLTIVTSHADIIVSGHGLPQVLQLRIFALLGSKDIEPVKLYDLGDVGIALSPAITVRGIAAVGVTQIIGGNYHCLRL